MALGANLQPHRFMSPHAFSNQESDQFRVVQLPDYPDYNDYKRTLTISGGFVMYLIQRNCFEDLEAEQWWRHLASFVGSRLPEIIVNYAPLAMNPFDIGIVYLWSQRDYHLVSCNLRKRNYTILRNASNDGHQDCLIDHFVCIRRAWMKYGIQDHHQIYTWTLEFVSRFAHSWSHGGWNRCLVLLKLRW